MTDEILCRCGQVRLLDPAVSYQRGSMIHARSHCQSTCSDCIALQRNIEALRTECERWATDKDVNVLQRAVYNEIEVRLRALLPGRKKES